VELILVCGHLITMPRYHFDIAGRKVFDSLAAVLPDTEAARTHAIDLATNIGKHTLTANAVRVIGEEGSVLFRVPIRRRPPSEYKTGGHPSCH
jgi:hypothetical protein